MRPGNRWIGLLLPFVAAATLLSAEPPSAAESEVLSVDAMRMEAMVKGDVAALSALLTADMVHVDVNGRVDDKQSILYGIRSRTTTYETIMPTERRARVFANVAVVRGVAAIRGVNRKERVDVTVRYLAVYERRSGRWQLTLAQSTEIITPGTVISGQSA